MKRDDDKWVCNALLNVSRFCLSNLLIFFEKMNGVENLWVSSRIYVLR